LVDLSVDVSNIRMHLKGVGSVEMTGFIGHKTVLIFLNKLRDV
jgi:hypothetical protein